MKKRQTTAAEWMERGRWFSNNSGHRVFYVDEGRGDAVIFLHGFPTWSHDYADVMDDMKQDYRSIAVDFPGYGASDKPRKHTYTVAGAADTVVALLLLLRIDKVHIVAHDFGTIVAQELILRSNSDQLPFAIETATLMNCSMVFDRFRPTPMLRMLGMPVIGPAVASMVNKRSARKSLDRGRGLKKFSDQEFNELWYGISLQRGHKIGHKLIRYNKERSERAHIWEQAVYDFPTPKLLLWGLDDPVSGRHVLEAAREKMKDARIVELRDVGHFPNLEAPKKVSDAIRSFLEDPDGSFLSSQ